MRLCKKYLTKKERDKYDEFRRVFSLRPYERYNVHVLKESFTNPLIIPEFTNRIVSARLIATGASVKTSVSGGNLTITLPAMVPDAIASVIKIDVRGSVSIKQSTALR